MAQTAHEKEVVVSEKDVGMDSQHDRPHSEVESMWVYERVAERVSGYEGGLVVQRHDLSVDKLVEYENQ